MFTVFYFGFSSGMVYNVHYCLDEILISTDSVHTSCDICGTDGNKDCCSSEVKILKTDVAQKADITLINHAPLAALLPQPGFVAFAAPLVLRNEFSVHINAPPEKPQLPLFITHCNFRI